MFVALYTRQQLSRIKQNLLLAGLFLLAGGGYAIVREFLWLDAVRPGWLVAAIVLMLGGATGMVFGVNLVPLRDAYFSMNSSQVRFRLTLLGRSRELRWTQVQSVRVTDEQVIFSLYSNKELVMRLSNIPDPKIARHIQASISLAAMEQNIRVNGVLARRPETTVEQPVLL